MASGRLGVGDVPGLKSVPMATGTPASTNARAGAWWSFMRNQVVTGSSVATTGVPASAAAAIAAIPAVGRRGQMVGRSRPQLGRELRATRRCQLIGMEPRHQPERCGRLEDAPRLVRREDTGLAEDVGEPRAAVGRDTRQLLLDQRADIGLGPVRAGAGTPGARRGRRARSARRRRDPRGRGDRRRRRAAAPSRGPARSRTWPRPSSRRGRASPRASAGRGPGARPRTRRASRRPSRGCPPPAARMSRYDAPLLAQDELVFAGPGEQQVRVRVDEARGHRAARCIDPREAGQREALRLERGLDRRARPDRDDAALPARRRPGRRARRGRLGAEPADLALARGRAAHRPRGSRPPLRPTIRRPGVGSPVRPPSMTRNGPPLTPGSPRSRAGHDGPRPAVPPEPRAGPPPAGARAPASARSRAVGGTRPRPARRVSTGASRPGRRRGRRRPGRRPAGRARSARTRRARRRPRRRGRGRVSQTSQSGVTAKSSRFIETWAAAA